MKTTDLQETLKALAAETSDAQASPEVMSALMSELAKRRKPHAAWRGRLMKAWPVAAAACLAAGFWIGTNRRQAVDSPAPTGPETAKIEQPLVVDEQPATAPLQSEFPAAAVPTGAPARNANRQQGFGSGTEYAAVTPWYFHAGLPTPATGRVIRMEVSAATAQQFGVYTTRKTADAEILMGDDGLARAIRFLSPVTRSAVVRASSRQE